MTNGDPTKNPMPETFPNPNGPAIIKAPNQQPFGHDIPFYRAPTLHGREIPIEVLEKFKTSVPALYDKAQIDWVRAENQPLVDAVWNGIETVGVNFVSGFGAGTGYLMHSVGDMLGGFEWGQSVIDASMRMQRDASDYVFDKNEESFNPLSIADWLNLSSDVAFSAGMMAPTVAASLATRGLIKPIASVSQLAGYLTEAATFTMLQRPAESLMEADEAKRRVYDEYKRSGFDEDTANKMAAKAAQQVYWDNMKLAGVDALQYALAFGPSRNLAGLRISKYGKYLDKPIVKYPLASFSEGLEEYVQYAMTNNAYDKQVRGTFSPEAGFLKQLEVAADDPEAITSFLAGAAGGALFQFAGPRLQKFAQSKEYKKYLKEQELELDKDLNDDEIRNVQDDIFYDLATRHIKAGKANKVQDFLDKASTIPVEELEKEGVNPEQFYDMVEKRKEEIKELGSLYNSIFNGKFSQPIKVALFEVYGQKSVNRSTIDRTFKDIDDLLTVERQSGNAFLNKKSLNTNEYIDKRIKAELDKVDIDEANQTTPYSEIDLAAYKRLKGIYDVKNITDTNVPVTIKDAELDQKIDILFKALALDAAHDEMILKIKNDPLYRDELEMKAEKIQDTIKKTQDLNKQRKAQQVQNEADVVKRAATKAAAAAEQPADVDTAGEYAGEGNISDDQYIKNLETDPESRMQALKLFLERFRDEHSWTINDMPAREKKSLLYFKNDVRYLLENDPDLKGNLPPYKVSSLLDVEEGGKQETQEDTESGMAIKANLIQVIQMLGGEEKFPNHILEALSVDSLSEMVEKLQEEQDGDGTAEPIVGTPAPQKGKDIIDVRLEPNVTDEEDVRRKRAKTIEELNPEFKGPHQTLAIMSIEWSTVQKIDGDNNVINVRQPISESLNPNMPDKAILSDKYYPVGTKLVARVLDDNNQDVYDPDTGATVKWGEYKEDLDQEDYIGKVPIGVYRGNKLVAYLHSTDWINADSYNAELDQIDKSRALLYARRAAIVENGQMDIEISNREGGKLVQTLDKRLVSLSESLPAVEIKVRTGEEKDAKFDEDLTIFSNKAGITILDGDIIAYAAGNDPAFFFPESRKLNNTEINSIVKAVATFVNAEKGEFYQRVKADMGLDLSQLNDLRKYVSLFTRVYDVPSSDMGVDVRTGGFNSQLHYHITKRALDQPVGVPGFNDAPWHSFLSIQGNQISWTIGGGESNLVAGTEGQQLHQFKSGNISPNVRDAVQRARMLDELTKHLQHSKINVSAGDLNKTMNIVMFDGDSFKTGNVVSQKVNYTEFVKERLYSNYLSFNIGTEENPEYIYKVNPIIEYRVLQPETSQVTEHTDPIIQVEPNADAIDVIKATVPEPTSTKLVVSSKEFNELADKLKQGRTLVPVGDYYQYEDEGKKPTVKFPRVTTIRGKKKFLDNSSADRGSILDALFRAINEGRIKKGQELFEFIKDTAANYPDANAFSAEFIVQSYDAFYDTINTLKSLGWEIRTDIPPQTVIINGETYAGTMDALMRSPEGEVVIGDLKTSAVDRVRQYMIDENLSEISREDAVSIKAKLALEENQDAKADLLWLLDNNKLTPSEAATLQRFIEKFPALVYSYQGKKSLKLYTYKDSDSTQLSAYALSVLQNGAVRPQRAAILGYITSKNYENVYYSIKPMNDNQFIDVPFDRNIYPDLSTVNETKTPQTTKRVLTEEELNKQKIAQGVLNKLKDEFGDLPDQRPITTEEQQQIQKLIDDSAIIPGVPPGDLRVAINSASAMFIRKLEEIEIQQRKPGGDVKVAVFLKKPEIEAIFNDIKKRIVAQQVEYQTTIEVYYKNPDENTGLIKWLPIIENRLTSINAILDNFEKFKSHVVLTLSGVSGLNTQLESSGVTIQHAEHTQNVEDFEGDEELETELTGDRTEEDKGISSDKGDYKEQFGLLSKLSKSQKKSMSSKLKLFFQSIPLKEVVKVSNMSVVSQNKTNLFGLDDVLDPDEVVDYLYSLLSNKYLTFEEMLDEIRSNVNDISWLESVAHALEHASDTIKRDFQLSMNVMDTNMRYVLIRQGSSPTEFSQGIPTEYYVLNDNASKTNEALRKRWLTYFTQSELFEAHDGKLSFNVPKKRELLEKGLRWSRELVDPKKMPPSKEEFREYLMEFGITLNDAVLDKIFYTETRQSANAYRVQGRIVTYRDQFTAGRRGIIPELIRIINSLEESSDPNSSLAKTPDSTQFSSGILQALAKEEVRFHAGLKTASFYSGGKAVASNMNPTYINRRTFGIKNGILMSKFSANPAISSTAFFKAFKVQPAYLDQLSDSMISLAPISYLEGSRPVREYHKQSERNKEIYKLAQFTSARKRGGVVTSGSDKLYISGYFYPVSGDGLQQIVIDGPRKNYFASSSPELGTIDANYVYMTQEMVDDIFNDVVMPEVNRMILTPPSDNTKFENGRYVFHYLTDLNNLEELFDSSGQLVHTGVPEKPFTKEQEEAIRKTIIDVLFRVISEKQQRWLDLGINASDVSSDYKKIFVEGSNNLAYRDSDYILAVTASNFVVNNMRALTSMYFMYETDLATEHVKSTSGSSPVDHVMATERKLFKRIKTSVAPIVQGYSKGVKPDQQPFRVLVVNDIPREHIQADLDFYKQAGLSEEQIKALDKQNRTDGTSINHPLEHLMSLYNYGKIDHSTYVKAIMYYRQTGKMLKTLPLTSLKTTYLNTDASKAVPDRVHIKHAEFYLDPAFAEGNELWSRVWELMNQDPTDVLSSLNLSGELALVERYDAPVSSDEAYNAFERTFVTIGSDRIESNNQINIKIPGDITQNQELREHLLTAFINDENNSVNDLMTKVAEMHEDNNERGFRNAFKEEVAQRPDEFPNGVSENFIDNLYTILNADVNRWSLDEYESYLDELTRRVKRQDLLTMPSGYYMESLRAFQTQYPAHYQLVSEFLLNAEKTFNARPSLKENLKIGAHKISFKSAIKTGKYVPYDLVIVGRDENGFLTYTINPEPPKPENYLTLTRDGLGLQTHTPDRSEQREIGLGSQPAKQLFLDLPSSFNQKQMEFNRLYQQILDNQKKEFFDDIFYDEESGQFDMEAFLNKLKDFIATFTKDDNLFDSLAAVETIKGEIRSRAPLFAVASRNMIEPYLMSLISSVVSDIKMPGVQYTIKSDLFALDNSEITYTEAYDPAKGLQHYTYTEDGKTILHSQIIISWPFGKAFPIERYLTKEGKIDYNKLPKKLLQIVSDRIPATTQASIHIQEIVGFLPPQDKGSVITSAALMKQTGWDMDDDKLFIYFFPHIRTKDKFILIDDDYVSSLEKAVEQAENENVKVKKQKQLDEALKELPKGKLLDIFHQVILDPSPEVQKIVHKTVDTRNLERLYDKLLAQRASGFRKEKQIWRSPINEAFHSQVFENEAGVADGVGIHANALSLHSVVQTSYVYTDQRVSYLDPVQETDENGVPISNNKKVFKFNILAGNEFKTFKFTLGTKNSHTTQTILENLQASVDNGNLGIISEFNINQETINAYVAGGHSDIDIDNLIGLIEQPIIHAYAEIKRGAASQGEYISEYKILKRLLERFPNTLIEEKLNVPYDPKNKMSRAAHEQALAKEAFKVLDNFDRTIILGADATSDPNNLTLMDYLFFPENGAEKGDLANSDAWKVYNVFRHLDRFATILGTIQRRINIDSKGLPKRLYMAEDTIKVPSEIYDYYNEVANLNLLLGIDKHTSEFYGNKWDGHYFVDSYLTKSGSRRYIYMRPTTIYGMSVFTAIDTLKATVLNDKQLMYPYHTPSYMVVKENMLNILGANNREAHVKNRILGTLYSHMLSYLYSSKRSGVYDYNKRLVTRRRELFIDTKGAANDVNESLAKILYRAKQDPKLLKNKVIRELEPELAIPNMGQLSRIAFNGIEKDNIVRNALYNDFDALMASNAVIKGTNITHQEFALGLIEAALLSGGVQTRHSFIKVIPIKYFEFFGTYDYLYDLDYNDPSIFGTLSNTVAQASAKDTPQFFQLGNFELQALQHLFQFVIPTRVANDFDFPARIPISKKEKEYVPIARRFINSRRQGYYVATGPEYIRVEVHTIPGFSMFDAQEMYNSPITNKDRIGRRVEYITPYTDADLISGTDLDDVEARATGGILSSREIRDIEEQFLYGEENGKRVVLPLQEILDRAVQSGYLADRLDSVSMVREIAENSALKIKTEFYSIGQAQKENKGSHIYNSNTNTSTITVDLKNATSIEDFFTTLLHETFHGITEATLKKANLLRGSNPRIRAILQELSHIQKFTKESLFAKYNVTSTEQLMGVIHPSEFDLLNAVKGGLSEFFSEIKSSSSVRAYLNTTIWEGSQTLMERIVELINKLFQSTGIKIDLYERLGDRANALYDELADISIKNISDLYNKYQNLINKTGPVHIVKHPQAFEIENIWNETLKDYNSIPGVVGDIEAERDSSGNVTTYYFEVNRQAYLNYLKSLFLREEATISDSIVNQEEVTLYLTPSQITEEHVAEIIEGATMFDLIVQGLYDSDQIIERNGVVLVLKPNIKVESERQLEAPYNAMFNRGQYFYFNTKEAAQEQAKDLALFYGIERIDDIVEINGKYVVTVLDVEEHRPFNTAAGERVIPAMAQRTIDEIKKRIKDLTGLKKSFTTLYSNKPDYKLHVRIAEITREIEELKNSATGINELPSIERIGEFLNSRLNFLETKVLAVNERIKDKSYGDLDTVELVNLIKELNWIQAAGTFNLSQDHFLLDTAEEKLSQDPKNRELLAKYKSRAENLHGNLVKAIYNVITTTANLNNAGLRKNVTEEDIKHALRDITEITKYTNAVGKATYHPLITAIVQAMNVANYERSEKMYTVKRDLEELIGRMTAKAGNSAKAFGKFFQKDESGKRLNYLVNFLSHKYYQESRDHFSAYLKGINKRVISKQFKKSKKWIDENTEVVDFRKLLVGPFEGYEYNGPTFTPEEMLAYRNELVSKYGEYMVKRIENEAEVKMRRFVNAYRGKANADSQEAAQYEQSLFEASNSPFKIAEQFDADGKSIDYPSENYIIRVPKLKDKNGKSLGYVNEEFVQMMEDPDNAEFHDRAYNILREINLINGGEAYEYFSKNMMVPFLKKTFVEQVALAPNKAQGIYSKMFDDFVDYIRREEESEEVFEEVNPVTGAKYYKTVNPFPRDKEMIMARTKELQAMLYTELLGVKRESDYDKVLAKYNISWPKLTESRLRGALNAGTDAGLDVYLATIKDEFSKDLPRSVFKRLQDNATSEYYKDSSSDLPTMLVFFSGVSEAYKAKVQTEGFMNLAMDVFDSLETSNKTGAIYKGHSSNIKEALDYQLSVFFGGPRHNKGAAMNKKVYTEEEKRRKKEMERLIEETEDMAAKEMLRNRIAKLGKPVHYNRLVDGLLHYVSMLGLAWRLTSANFNLLIGQATNFVEAGSGRYFSDAAFGKALKLMRWSVLKNLTFNRYENKEARKIRSIMDRYDLLHDTTTELYKSSAVSGTFKWFRAFGPKNLTSRVEYLNQGAIVLAYMMDHKVSEFMPDYEGNESLLDAFNEDGTWNSAKFGDITRETKARIFGTIESIKTTLQGEYNYNNTVVGKRSLGGRMLYMFHSWFPEYIKVRLQEEREDTLSGEIHKGRWITLKEIVTGEINNNQTLSENALFVLKNIFKQSVYNQKFSKHDAANIRAFIRSLSLQVTLITGALVLKALGNLDDDDKYNDTENFLIYYLLNSSSRLNADMNALIGMVSGDASSQRSLVPALSLLNRFEKFGTAAEQILSDDPDAYNTLGNATMSFVPGLTEIGRIQSMGSEVW